MRAKTNHASFRKRFIGLAVLLSGITLFGYAVQPAFAAYTFAINPKSGGAGTVITLSGGGFPPPPKGYLPYCLITVSAYNAGPPSTPGHWINDCISGTYSHFQTDSLGNIPAGATLTVPSGLTCGDTYYVVVGSDDFTAIWAHAPLTFTCTSVPEFPLGIIPILMLAIPLLVLMRKKLTPRFPAP